MRSPNFIGIPPRQPGLRASPRFGSANKLRGRLGSPDLADSSAFGFVLASNRGSASNRPSRKAASAGSTFLVGGFRVRRVALAEPSLPYAKIKRPVGAKSRVPVECGGEDRGRACGDAIARVMFEVHSAIALPNRGLARRPG